MSEKVGVFTSHFGEGVKIDRGVDKLESHPRSALQIPG